MFVLPLDEAINLFTGGALVLLAASLLLLDRGKGEARLLSAFLAVVGLNFTFIGLAQHGGSDTLQRLAYVALAVDPLLLVGAVTVHPYRRRSARALVLLGVLAGMSAISGLLVVLSPDSFAYGLAGPQRRTSPLVFVVAGVAVGYLAAWLLAVDGLRRAPTRALTRRAAWFLGAVGVAVVPRLGLLPFDVGLARQVGGPAPLGLGSASAVAVDLLVYALIVVALLAAAAWRLRATSLRHGWAALAAVTVASTLFAVGQVLTGLAAVPAAVGDLLSILYTLRWPLFGTVLLAGVATQDLVSLRLATDRVIPTLGAVLGGLGGGLVTLSLMTTTTQMGTQVAMAAAAAVALGASGPCGDLARAGIHRLEQRAGPSVATGRRLELYRAALEEAWREGPPSPAARRALEAQQRQLGLSVPEARTLEHVVASGGTWSGPGAGDEPVPGLVLGELLGDGAQGRVFRARDHVAGRDVVVKVARKGRDGSGARRRLIREVAPLQALDHPGIVKLLDVHAGVDHHLLVLEMVKGRPLSSILVEQGALELETVASLARQSLEALAAAHNAGVRHRDLKPSNLLLTREGRAVITDFGLAAWTDSADPTATVAAGDDGVPAGTPAYMAPEQARGHEATAATDLYQLGLVLYEAITGRRALDVRGYGLVDALAVAAAPVVEVDRVPEPWRPVLSKALAVDPEDRFASAEEMLDAVVRVGRPTGSAPG